MSFITRKTLNTGVRFLSVLLSVSIVVVVLKKNQDEDALKREQTLQIDVAFIIHGSKNITSPPRKKSLKDALDWAKKITKAFGEVGVNKTHVGLILYAEKAKLMFNMTEKLNKGEVMGGLDEASSPPALGNKTFTGKALKLALKTLVKQTRKEAIKKFFVFTDRPPDDDPMSPADAIKEKEVEVYGLNGNAPPSTWFIHDYSLDSMYEMLKEGPFKGNRENTKDKSYQDITDISNPTEKPSLTVYNDSLKTPELKQLATEYSMNVSTTGNNSQNFSQNGQLQNAANTNASTLVSQDFVSSNGSLSNLGSNGSNPGNQLPHSETPLSNRENQVSTTYLENQGPNSGNQVPTPDIPITNSVNTVQNPGNIINPGNETAHSTTPMSNRENQVSTTYLENQEPNPGNQIPTPDIPITNSVNTVQNPGNIINPGNETAHSTTPLSNRENQMSTTYLENQEPNPGNPAPKPNVQISNSVNTMQNPGNIINPGNEAPQSISNPINLKLEHQISGLISQENQANEEEHTDIKYGKDASVVITENSMKSRNAVGKYSSTINVTPSATEFGTVIGGVRVHGQSKFDVFKPNNMSENSNLRSKLANRNIIKTRYKNRKKLTKHL